MALGRVTFRSGTGCHLSSTPFRRGSFGLIGGEPRHCSTRFAECQVQVGGLEKEGHCGLEASLATPMRRCCAPVGGGRGASSARVSALLGMGPKTRACAPRLGMRVIHPRPGSLPDWKAELEPWHRYRGTYGEVDGCWEVEYDAAMWNCFSQHVTQLSREARSKVGRAMRGETTLGCRNNRWRVFGDG